MSAPRLDRNARPPRIALIPLRHNLVIAAGAILGVLARFLAGEWSKAQLTLTFPLSTLIVNLAGCLLIGIVQTIFGELRVIRPEIQLFLVVGVLGGFTTFSTLSMDTVRLLQAGLAVQAIVYQALSLVGGVAAVAIGIAATHTVTRRLHGPKKA